MPELPEVETVRRQLSPALAGRRLASVQILDPRWTRPHPPREVAAALSGARIRHVGRAGKYLVWELDGDRYLLIHLRMTGTLLLDPTGVPPHTRATFALDDGRRLVYADPRRFGTAELLSGEDALRAYLDARLGPEPLTAAFTAAYLARVARGRSAPVKAFILDQRRVAGVGNIYADEALFRAGIHPLRPAGTLRGPAIERLREGIEQALREGIDAKGASIDDFRHVDGARGSFQERFLVHRRAGRPCPACGEEIVKIVVGGRGTYLCQRCQPRPRVRRPRRATAAPSRAAD